METVTPAASVASPAAGEGDFGRKTGSARTNRKQGGHKGWNQQKARCAQDLILASRLGGGGNVHVKVLADGTTRFTVEVRQSRDAVLPLVERTAAMRLQGAAVQEKRQQQWYDQAVQQARMQGQTQPAQ